MSKRPPKIRTIDADKLLAYLRRQDEKARRLQDDFTTPTGGRGLEGVHEYGVLCGNRGALHRVEDYVTRAVRSRRTP